LEDDHLRLRERPASAVDKGCADLIVATGKTPDRHPDRLRRFRPIELNPPVLTVNTVASKNPRAHD
jgi:hypothetical protein